MKMYVLPIVRDETPYVDSLITGQTIHFVLWVEVECQVAALRGSSRVMFFTVV
jgi:hypothetical protein